MWSRVIVCLLFLSTLMGTANAHTHRYSSSTPDVNSFFFGGNNRLSSKPQYVHHVAHKHLAWRRVRFGHHSVPVLNRQSGDLVTVPTAAGISITVATKLAPQFQGFVADLVNLGYTPHHIGCWAPVGTHVANSNHYHGGACDFDQTGWGRTAARMYHVSALAARWGLRDGCSFHRPDCGHVDDGTNIRWKHPNNLIARYIDFQNKPENNRQRQTSPLEPFEE